MRHHALRMRLCLCASRSRAGLRVRCVAVLLAAACRWRLPGYCRHVLCLVCPVCDTVAGHEDRCVGCCRCGAGDYGRAAPVGASPLLGSLLAHVSLAQGRGPRRQRAPRPAGWHHWSGAEHHHRVGCSCGCVLDKLLRCGSGRRHQQQPQAVDPQRPAHHGGLDPPHPGVAEVHPAQGLSLQAVACRPLGSARWSRCGRSLVVAAVASGHGLRPRLFQVKHR
mmetsp:Transcript_63610/g.140054  ORF Transcript_63610/g.140054 Transcript_63610/m.140054 type:complete len:222 (+) Transcript_63610:1506-2171(+)